MNKDKILRALDDILDDLAYEADHAESSSSKEDFEEKYGLIFDAMIFVRENMGDGEEDDSKV
ncbi:hypothetical protein [Enterococcus faecalis]|nr:hypothetical protein [Enterococcus faecalis]MBJ0426261.1 hypothetical protein [Enterococcus faecalis]MBJ1666595.1 hypothetical protein [Enterococcus faecalis]MBJ1685059.1 hypothetical protein [Enterococcus faecalis]MBJ1690484.1 hypothetical protein [Enterococcus faecalis]MDF4229255.1 hypothetical protein [Enterococcus faecalis]